jgi:hypothetical protein
MHMQRKMNRAKSPPPTRPTHWLDTIDPAVQQLPTFGRRVDIPSYPAPHALSRHSKKKARSKSPSLERSRIPHAHLLPTIGPARQPLPQKSETRRYRPPVYLPVVIIVGVLSAGAVHLQHSLRLHYSASC